jgi:hypothetical protein
LITAPVLAYPQAEGSEFILDTDASDYAIGAVLSQVQDVQFSDETDLTVESICEFVHPVLKNLSAMLTTHGLFLI